MPPFATIANASIPSLGRDDCGAEFIELKVTHRDFEAAIDALAACR